jgi:hypothetical protein
MRYTATLFVMSVIWSVSAQPVLNSSEMLAPGNTTYMRFLQNFSAVDTTIQGANAVWDFTAMMPDPQQAQYAYTIVEPSSTPNASTFPSANYAYWENGLDYYRYFNLTPTFMERVGSYTQGPYVFQDPQKEFVFPMTLGTTNTDDWWGVADGGQYRINCVGYGTLHVPGAVLEDVLMVRAKVNGTLYNVDMYFWYSSDDGRILMQFIQSNIVTQSLYYDGFAMAMHEGTAYQTALLGNPVISSLDFVLGTSPGPLQYNIISTSGAILGQGQIAGMAGVVESIDVSGYASGVYVLQLLKSGQPASETIRFMK